MLAAALLGLAIYAAGVAAAFTLMLASTDVHSPLAFAGGLLLLLAITSGFSVTVHQSFRDQRARELLWLHQQAKDIQQRRTTNGNQDDSVHGHADAARAQAGTALPRAAGGARRRGPAGDHRPPHQGAH